MKTIAMLFIIDDDAAFRFLAEEIINDTNRVQDVKTFINGMQAIDYIRDRGHDPAVLPEVILLDLNMPVMDGWGFLKAFQPLRQQLKKKIRISLVTSSIDPNDAMRARGCELVDEYIIKPVTPEKIIEIIEEL